MTIEVELQIASQIKTLPHPSQFRQWITQVMQDQIDNDAELAIRIVDEPEMTLLNQQYRNKNGPTNVLSFPANDEFYDIDTEDDFEYQSLGDIVICAPIVEQEAIQNDKELLSHWAHLVIHGALHLLGFDHQNDDEAEEMEQLETEIMLSLGFAPPYGEIYTR